MTHANRVPSVFALAAAIGFAASYVRADLTPEWISQLPAGSSLTAGLQGLVVDSAGVSYITGIVGPSSNTDILTAAFAPDGTVLWSHVFNGSANWHDQARGIALGPGGVVYVTGNTPGPGSYANVLLLKYDAATGALLNTVQYSSGPFLSEYGGAVAADEFGGVYVGGGTVGDGPDTMTIKFDENGQMVWRQLWDGPAWSPYSQDSVEGIAVAPDRNPVVMIHGVMGSLHPDYVLIKHDADTGSVLWETNWGVSGGDFPADMEFDAEGDLYVTGTALDNGNYRYGTIKLRGSDGQLLWQAYDGIQYHNSVAGLALDGAGGVYVTGQVDPDGDRSNGNNNFYSVKRDAGTGALLWTHSYGANCLYCGDVPGDVIVDSADHVFLIGTTSSPPYSGEMILFSLDSNTGVETERGTVGGGPDEFASGWKLRLDRAENIFVGGGYSNFNTGAEGMAVFKYPSMSGIPGDLDGDGDVDLADLALMLSAFGSCEGDANYNAAADLDGSGCVELVDLSALLANFGG